MICRAVRASTRSNLPLTQGSASLWPVACAMGNISPAEIMARIIHTALVCGLFVARCFGQPSGSLIFDNARPGHLDEAVESTTQAAPVCYTCFFQSSGIQLQAELIAFYRSQFKTTDPLVAGDARFILCAST